MLTLAAIPRLRWPRLTRRWLTSLPLLPLLAYALYTFVGPNFHSVIDGRVYRSNQLSGDGLASYLKSRGIRTVVNLRGHCAGFDWYTAEAAAIAACGASQEDITFSANRLPPPVELRRLVEVLDGSEYPILLHCKQGADRTGLASAMVLLLYTDASLSRARTELLPHRGHFRVARTAAMDEFFDRYEAWLHGDSHTPAKFRDWCLNHYKPGPASAALAWVTPIPDSLPAAVPFALTLRATNTSDDDWQFQCGHTAGLHLAYKLYDKDGTVCVSDVAGLVRRTVTPGGSIDFLLVFPKLPPGPYTLRAEMADFAGAGLAVRAQYFFQFNSDAAMATIDLK